LSPTGCDDKPIETCIKNPKHKYEEHCYQSYSPTQVWMKKVLRNKQPGSVNGVCGAIDVVSGFPGVDKIPLVGQYKGVVGDVCKGLSATENILLDHGVSWENKKWDQLRKSNPGEWVTLTFDVTNFPILRSMDLGPAPTTYR
jgi:hypothetical protein